MRRCSPAPAQVAGSGSGATAGAGAAVAACAAGAADVDGRPEAPGPETGQRSSDVAGRWVVGVPQAHHERVGRVALRPPCAPRAA